MGLLSQGSPLSWEETQRHADHVRRHGILQFLHIYHAVKDRHKDVLKWGDEVEYMLVSFDHENKKVQLILSGEEVLEILQEKGERTNPKLGCPGFTLPEYKPNPVEGGASKSLFFPDEAINKHPRFGTLTRNIRHRRGEKVVINVPIFKDKNTPSPFIETFPEDDEAARASKPDHIYMDAMGFGMGNCCLQPLKNNNYRISKSRYDSIDSYLSKCGEKYNDIDLTIDKEIYEQLLREGIDHLLAQHVAHLFIRDPLTLFEEKIHLNDATESDHFENIQSTNWQTMRFKPPPPNSDIGWRVEFRPMEVQLTDFENSAYVVFVVLLTRVILSYKLDFLIPLSKVDENMKEAQKRDAVLQGMFYFRKDICKGGNAVVDGCSKAQNSSEQTVEEYTLMSIDTIINGKEGVFPGLIPILNSYLENMEVDVDTRCSILNYLKLIKKRASGELMTVARWMREFIANHPDYKQDSVITDEMNYSLISKCNQIANELCECPELLGPAFRKVKYSGSKTESSN
ncbi:Glutamate--cysteine ligase catalytic subunit [Tupaia chinensis]|uniref:Glutamate--cysteine ligase n=1 Tax=Tupaia chinensis TaxID=246437 RepID=L8Y6B7_TUPCH|nr:Glutamate--cysteine ligase catalytic subunit [Tupaia chinensis]